MFQDLFVPGETEYNRETERHIAEIIIDRKLEILQCTLALIDWCMDFGPLPQDVTDDPKTAIVWYRREGKAWHESRKAP